MKRSLIVLLAAVLASGCAVSRTAKKDAKKAGPAAGASEDADGAPLPPGSEVTEASLRGSGFDIDPDIKPVHFDYDSAQLSGEALDTLKANAAKLKAKKGYDVLVAGHCDERGTVAYNLALGQKRAKEVREYYMRLGVDGRRVATISYGKEQPECSESTEECWSSNRRAVTGLRAKKKAAGAAAAGQ